MIFKRYKFLILLGLCLLTSLSFAKKLDGIAAVVNDDVLTYSELNDEVATLKDRLSKQRQPIPNDNILKKQVLSRLIDIKLQLQIAKRYDLRVTAKEVEDAIKKVAKQNRITVSELQSKLSQQGLNWARYREDLKKELIIAKLQQGAVGNVLVSDEEVDKFAKTQSTQSEQLYHIKDILLSLPEAPSPETLKKAQEKAQSLLKALRKGDDFSKAAITYSSDEFAFKGGDLGTRKLSELPEIFAAEVTHMKPGDIKGPIRAPNGLHIIKLVKSSKQANHAAIRLTHVRHILLRVAPGELDNQVKERLRAIALQIKQGKSFEKLAKQFSMDPQSATNGGDIGWVHKGEVVPQFEDAMNKLKPGQMSDIVKTDFGYHLIKVEGRKLVDDSKAYQHEMIRQGLYRRKFYEAMQKWLRELRANAYINIEDKALA